MTTIKRFEDINAWKKARVLTNEVYKITYSGEFAKDFGLKDQIRRAVVSILSNITEGFERKGDKEFSGFLQIAKGSTGEVKAQLYVALDAGFIDKETFKQLYDSADELGRMIFALKRYLSGKIVQNRENDTKVD